MRLRVAGERFQDWRAARSDESLAATAEDLNAEAA